MMLQFLLLCAYIENFEFVASSPEGGDRPSLCLVSMGSCLPLGKVSGLRSLCPEASVHAV